MLYDEPVKITINTPALTEIIIKMVVRYHGLWDLIISNQGSVFT